MRPHSHLSSFFDSTEISVTHRPFRTILGQLIPLIHYTLLNNLTLQQHPSRLSSHFNGLLGHALFVSTRFSAYIILSCSRAAGQGLPLSRTALFSLLFLPALILCIHLAIVDYFRAPFVRYLPHSELAVLTGGEEHILQLIVVDEADSVCERGLKHEDAFTALFNVSDPDQALLGAFAVAGHAGQPLEAVKVVFAVAFVGFDHLDDGGFDHTSVNELDDGDYASF